MAKAHAAVEQSVVMSARGGLRLPEVQRRFIWHSTRTGDLRASRYRSDSGRFPTKPYLQSAPPRLGTENP